jgi:hypothetical protein
MNTQPDLRFVICRDNTGVDDLQVRKLYRVIPDAAAIKSDYIRVVDDSGEDYLYPADFFVAVELSDEAQRALRRAG